MLENTYEAVGATIYARVLLFFLPRRRARTPTLHIHANMLHVCFEILFDSQFSSLPRVTC